MYKRTHSAFQFLPVLFFTFISILCFKNTFRMKVFLIAFVLIFASLWNESQSVSYIRRVPGGGQIPFNGVNRRPSNYNNGRSALDQPDVMMPQPQLPAKRNLRRVVRRPENPQGQERFFWNWFGMGNDYNDYGPPYPPGGPGYPQGPGGYPGGYPPVGGHGPEICTEYVNPMNPHDMIQDCETIDPY